MTTIDAKIIEDSLSPDGVRLTTFSLRYPRFAHADFMTHRMFSRNASSSRAMPVSTTIQLIEDDPAIPIYWGKNRKGMHPTEELSKEQIEKAERIWLNAKDDAIRHARELQEIGVHKQHVNRIIEPYSHISVVATATDWNNFLNLRISKDVQPELENLATQMINLFFKKNAKQVGYESWHLPFINKQERENHDIGELVMASVARCARVSYLKHDKTEPSIEEDIKLYNKLLESGHMSPFEHQAKPNSNPNEYSGNFRGWTQYRKTISGENKNIFPWLK